MPHPKKQKKLKLIQDLELIIYYLDPLKIRMPQILKWMFFIFFIATKPARGLNISPAWGFEVSVVRRWRVNLLGHVTGCGMLSSCAFHGMMGGFKVGSFPNGCWTKNRWFYPQNGCFIMENPIKMDDLGGKIIFGNTQISGKGFRNHNDWVALLESFCVLCILKAERDIGSVDF